MCGPQLDISILYQLKSQQVLDAVIKSRGPGISPSYYECGPRLLLLENKRKIGPKEIPSGLIPCTVLARRVSSRPMDAHFWNT